MSGNGRSSSAFRREIDVERGRRKSAEVPRKKNGNAVGRCRWDEAYGTNGPNRSNGANGRLLYLFAGGVEDLTVGEENDR